MLCWLFFKPPSYLQHVEVSPRQYIISSEHIMIPQTWYDTCQFVSQCVFIKGGLTANHFSFGIKSLNYFLACFPWQFRRVRLTANKTTSVVILKMFILHQSHTHRFSIAIIKLWDSACLCYTFVSECHFTRKYTNNHNISYLGLGKSIYYCCKAMGTYLGLCSEVMHREQQAS